MGKEEQKSATFGQMVRASSWTRSRATGYRRTLRAGPSGSRWNALAVIEASERRRLGREKILDGVEWLRR